MQDAPERMNKSATRTPADTPMTRAGSLDVLARALTRKRPGHPREHLIKLLAQQCRNFDLNPGCDAAKDPADD
jgi:hypothetical protein